MVHHYMQHRRSEQYDDDDRSRDLVIGYQANRRNTQEVTEEEGSGYEMMDQMWKKVTELREMRKLQLVPSLHSCHRCAEFLVCFL